MSRSKQKYSHLQKKFVVNESNGEMLGYIVDMDLSTQNLCVESIIVKEPQSLFSRLKCLFVSNPRIVISVDNIVNIGKDIILVKVR